MNTRARHRKVTHRPPNAAAKRGMLAALEALYTETPPLGDLLAERERVWREEYAQRRRQGELRLGPAG